MLLLHRQSEWNRISIGARSGGARHAPGAGARDGRRHQLRTRGRSATSLRLMPRSYLVAPASRSRVDGCAGRGLIRRHSSSGRSDGDGLICRAISSVRRRLSRVDIPGVNHIRSRAVTILRPAQRSRHYGRYFYPIAFSLRWPMRRPVLHQKFPKWRKSPAVASRRCKAPRSD